MKLEFKKLNRDAIIPSYGRDGDSGFDFSSVISRRITIQPGETMLIPTGLSVNIPENYEIQIRPRSGLTLNTKLRIANSPGTIDSNFLGEICIIVDNISQTQTEYINFGDRIAQGVLCKVTKANIEEVEIITKETNRGTNGFGSSGV
ncbi:MAG TPA: dUTP diphosphatase [Patescibacteria group bacterium]|nr:MAG: Deoxyuridine 5'-triphosphate nucleotidohydrolase [candidate division TM6 bacterium GW2011_GWF2_33_332]HLD91133.1 dUTP diphosphatase [Patescibacteria group bacterium]